MFKFIYSCRLAEMGFATQAFHYCEVIAKSILLRPRAHSPVLVRQLVQVLSSRVSAPARQQAWAQGRGGRVGSGLGSWRGGGAGTLQGRCVAICVLAQFFSCLTPAQEQQ